jgi:hypothetical protein
MKYKVINMLKDKDKDKNSTGGKAPLLNEASNHLALQLKNSFSKRGVTHKKVDSSCESPLGDIVTAEYVRGYN